MASFLPQTSKYYYSILYNKEQGVFYKSLKTSILAPRALSRAAKSS